MPAIADVTTSLAQFLTGLPAWAPIKHATVTLTNTNALALRATPITLVAAIAGKRHIFQKCFITSSAAAGAYVESTANLVVRYVGTSGVIASEAIEMTGFIDQAAVMYTQGRAKLDVIATAAQCVNVPLVVHNTGAGEWTGGNAANTITIVTQYVTLPA
jgi:hypothetical protein